MKAQKKKPLGCLTEQRQGAEKRFDECHQNTPLVPGCQDPSSWFARFFKKGETTEIRALGLTGKGPWKGWARGTVSGYFDDPDKLAAAVKSLDGLKRATGIYFTLNPVDPALLARANNRLVAPKATTTDGQIVYHRWLLIDTDPERPSGISATDTELEKAINCRDEIADFLHTKSWPDPIKAHSGNGGHLLYKLPDLPNTPEIAELKRQTLKALNYKFGGNGVEVDQKVFNAARICKLYDTWARKGDSTDDRPHRHSYLENIPESIKSVTLEQLQWLVSLAPRNEAGHNTQNQSPNGRKLDVPAYLAHYGIEVARVKSEGNRTIYGLRECIFNPEHTSNESAIVQSASGLLTYQCFHNSCQGRTWAEARELISGNDSLAQFYNGYDIHQGEGSKTVQRKTGKALTGQAETQDENTEKSSFYIAKKQYPRTGFPWDVLPVSIADSLKQLARSCATSPTSLPSAAISIFASTVGSTVNVYPKKSWREPLIFWCGDIRPSGEGKTPGPRALCNVLYEAQQMANEVYKMELELWDLQKKKDRGKPPDKPRGYFVTDLTLEGLRSDHSGHGGKVCVLDELSSFLTSQNQYKKKGSDRESWLCLHDGHPARIVRAKETITLSGCRVSVFGGIQPGVWQKIFSAEDGFYLVDGTIYRFLPTYEGSSFYPLTRESWSDENGKAWESLLKNALSWADAHTESGKLILSEDAQRVFFDWRNDLFQTKDDLPAQIQGFIPKLVGYALRLAGVLYLMHMFSQGQEIGGIIHRDYIEKGMRVSEFYLGHIICAIEALAGDASSPLEFTEQVIHLAKTLESIRTDLDSGRLAIGYIQEKFNETCRPELRVKTPKAMGALLRKCKLTVTDGRFNANGKRGVKCLQWDEKTNSFIESCPPSPPSPPAKEYQGLQPADIEKPKSAMSAGIDIKDSKKRTLRTLKNQCPQLETGSIINKADIADLADDFSKEKEKKSFEQMGLQTEMEALPKDYQEREELEI